MIIYDEMAYLIENSLRKANIAAGTDFAAETSFPRTSTNSFSVIVPADDLKE